ncbi:molybdopterin-binding protein [Vibrio sp.]|nr:molybdopterin-binding protein [Vibrio sp.]
MLKIAMLSTGEEVLHGDIVDTNASWLSDLFFQQGFPLCKRSTVGDELESLRDEFLLLSFNHNIVIVNGGLGPTTDDVTAEAAAEAADEHLKLFDEWVSEMDMFFRKRKVPMSDSNLKQALLPQSCTIIPNPVGTACGFKMTINDCLFYFTPGVPSEFHKMTNEQILPDLRSHFPEQLGKRCHRFYTLGTSESTLAEQLDKLPLPDGFMIGYRSYIPYIEVKVFGPEQHPLFEQIITLFENTLGDYIISSDIPPSDVIGYLLSDKPQSLVLIEQSTLGNLTTQLRQCERNEFIKHSLIYGKLNHENQDPIAHVLALSKASKDKQYSDYVLVTGEIEENVFSVALSTPDEEWAQILKFKRTRNAQDNATLITAIAMDMLIRYLTQRTIFTDYGHCQRLSEAGYR